MIRIIRTPFWLLTATAQDGKLASLHFTSTVLPAVPDEVCAADAAVLDETARQLNEYFAGFRHAFDLPLSPRGTAFQQAVWAQLCAIPYGEVRTYSAIARALGKPGASRAVGMACHVNPIAIVVPCHRVVGKAGLTGYAGGLHIKEALLRMEGIV